MAMVALWIILFLSGAACCFFLVDIFRGNLLVPSAYSLGGAGGSGALFIMCLFSFVLRSVRQARQEDERRILLSSAYTKHLLGGGTFESMSTSSSKGNNTTVQGKQEPAVLSSSELGDTTDSPPTGVSSSSCCWPCHGDSDEEIVLPRDGNGRANVRSKYPSTIIEPSAPVMDSGIVLGSGNVALQTATDSCLTEIKDNLEICIERNNHTAVAVLLDELLAYAVSSSQLKAFRSFAYSLSLSLSLSLSYLFNIFLSFVLIFLHQPWSFIFLKK